MICPHCKTDNRDGAKFCDECGFPLTGLIAQSEAENALHEASSRVDDEPGERDAAAGVGEVDDNESPEGDAGTQDAAIAGDDGAQDTADADDRIGFGMTPGREAPASPIEGEASDAPADEARPAHPHRAVELPTIEVRGLNVDDEGHPFSTGEFDFSDVELPGEGAAERGRLDARDLAADVPPIDAADGTRDASADETNVMRPVSADQGGTQPETSGLDELGATGELWSPDQTMELPLVADPNMPQKSGYRAPEGDPSKKRGKGKIAVIAVIVVVVLAAVVAGVTYGLQLWGGKAVPDVVGMTQADATDVLETSGFTVRATEVRSDDTEGLVLLSDPAAGGRAEEGSEVVIHVAIARTIPEVVGMAQADAQKALSDAGYTRVSVATEKSNEAEGTVLAVSPDQGSKANASTAVTLTVAEPYRVPDVVGQQQADAQAAIEAEGYVVNVSRSYTEDVPEGQVMSVEPSAGTVLESGSTVTIYVATSRGNELVNVTYGLIYAGANLSVGGVNYTVTSVDSVTYQGNDTVSYTFTGTPYTYFLGVRLELDPTSVSGTLTFADDNSVSGSSPSFSVAS